ncbi:probable glycerol-3-phosphate acyltransferase 3 [Lolium rigidum]|uniref:probable glycerol-3-phosphate acyltransferase 3 n=1 Tax=Lolium rigidum TaxID=89674 RepID=UPI001F5D37B7|nr:probable glycerol-3-phosphate acyltransferase 3 [Lolium rigidum]
MVKKPSPFRKSFSPIRRLLRRNLSGRHYRHPTTATTAKTTTSSPPAENLQGQTVIVDVEAWLLRSRLSTFAYFMLVAVEAGGFLRGLLLLLSYPFMCLLSGDMRLRAMVMVTFFGLREKEVARVGKAVLPKLFLEEMAMEGLDAVKDARRVVAVCTLFPRVMAEGFLKEYLGVDTVVGKEVMAVAGRYVGFIVDEALTLQTDGAPVGEEMKEMMNKGKHEEAFGLVGTGSRMNHLFSYYCKETYAVSEADKTSWQPLPRDKYPKPLVFHDGRLAFTPTFPAAIAMYTYLPFGIVLAIFRSLAYSLLPYCVSIPLGALTGMRSRVIAGPPIDATEKSKAGGRLYVCNHRTLLDPITVAACLNKPVTAVTYSVSPVSELIAPIRTARLTRDRDEDRRRMAALLARGDLVVCPEGTTCREPYLLRFSPLFTELTAEVTPVALETNVDMFYGTSTKPASKVLDPLYFMMNPRPEYRVEFLDPVRTATSTNSQEGHNKSQTIEAANRVQRVLGEALAFELTEQTRKDKYMMLAGNEGVVQGKVKK